MKHIKKIKPAAQDAVRSTDVSAKGAADARILKDLRPCIPVDGN